MSTVDELLEAAETARRAGDWPGAAEAYGRVLLEDAEPAHLWVQYGHVLKEARLLEDAAHAYRRAIARDGTDPDPWLHLAHLLKRMNRFEEARAAFRRLGALPDGPPVDHEIAGLTVALASGSVARNEDTERPSGDAIDRALAVFSALAPVEEARDRRTEAENARLAAEVPAEARGWFGADVPVPAQLDPQRHLVIRDGAFLATTADPQFALVVEGTRLAPGWYDVEVAISETPGRPYPVLYVETERDWSRFDTFRLAERAEGVYGATVHLTAPSGRLRLDPMDIEGRFEAGEVRVTLLSRAGLLKRLFQADRAGLARCLGRLSREPHLDRLLARHVAVAAPDRYRRWLEDRDGNRPAAAAPETKIPLRIVIDARREGDPSELAAAILSVRRQLYGDFVLDIILDGAPASQRRRIDARTLRDPRLRVLPAPDLTGEPYDDEPAGGPAYYLTMSPFHRLADGALARWVSHLERHPGQTLVYADSDLIDRSGRRHAPRFRPEWNEDYFLTGNYLGDMVMVRAPALRAAVRGAGFEADHPYPALVRLCETLASDAVGHIAEILYHERDDRPRPAATVVEADRRALEESLARRGVTAAVITAPGGYRHIRWPLPVPAPHVTIIIPTRDHVDLLRACVSSILEKTDYPSFDILIVDNGSVDADTRAYLADLPERVAVLPVPGPFNFSRLNNRAVAEARGSLVALVNNDVMAMDAEWLTEMAAQASRPGIGAVGAKLLYGSGHVQHAGIVLGIGSVAGHGHKYAEGDAVGYMGRLACAQAVSAVTGACLVVDKGKYLAVGGMDEEALQVAFNDVDLCLKLEQRGWRSLFTPHARLRHLESVSRGLDTSPEKAARFLEEAAVMQARWGERLRDDPYYSPHLTRAREDFTL
ncbi:glycosyltransferase [Ensifer soli]|uniref:glycosyltransferase n=1 Tax=Ciceribacter sp. sgz301302 TaxID=3342379 RepID=UPI0035B7BB6F